MGRQSLDECTVVVAVASVATLEDDISEKLPVKNTFIHFGGAQGAGSVRRWITDPSSCPKLATSSSTSSSPYLEEEPRLLLSLKPLPLDGGASAKTAVGEAAESTCGSASEESASGWSGTSTPEHSPRWAEVAKAPSACLSAPTPPQTSPRWADASHAADMMAVVPPPPPTTDYYDPYWQQWDPSPMQANGNMQAWMSVPWMPEAAAMFDSEAMINPEPAPAIFEPPTQGCSDPPALPRRPLISYDDGSLLFSFMVKRAIGVGFGISVERSEDNRTLLVTSVLPEGAIGAWNRQVRGGPMSKKALLRGDMILAINGKKDCDSMLYEMETSSLLRIEASRQAKR